MSPLDQVGQKSEETLALAAAFDDLETDFPRGEIAEIIGRIFQRTATFRIGICPAGA